MPVQYTKCQECGKKKKKSLAKYCTTCRKMVYKRNVKNINVPTGLNLCSALKSCLQKEVNSDIILPDTLVIDTKHYYNSRVKLWSNGLLFGAILGISYAVIVLELGGIL